MAIGGAVHASTPGNGWVVWASNRTDGRHEIYLMKSDGSGVKRLTFSGGDFPGWSPDGRWIAYTHTPDNSTHVVRWTGAGDKKVCDGELSFWMWDGSGLICRDADDFYRADPDTGSVQLVFKKTDFSAMGINNIIGPGGISWDGRWMVAHSDIYRNGYTGTNGTFKAYHAAVVLDFQDKSKIYFLGEGCEPITPPWGSLIYHVCGGGACATHPDPYRMDLKDLMTRGSYAPEIAHDDPDWGHEYFPRVSNDNLWLTYAATTGCHDHETCDYEVFSHKLGAGSADRTRLTTDPSNDRWPHLWVGTLPEVDCLVHMDCDDADPCTTDTCDPATQACQHSIDCVPDTGPRRAMEAGAPDRAVGGDPTPTQGGCTLGDAAGGSPAALLLLLGLWGRIRRRSTDSSRTGGAGCGPPRIPGASSCRSRSGSSPR